MAPDPSGRPPRGVVGNVLETANVSRIKAMNVPVQAIGSAQKLAAAMRDLGREVRAAARSVALAPASQKNRALAAMARAIRGSRAQILAANAQDVAQAKAAGATAAFIDRLTLNDARIEAMAAGIDVVRKLKDPVGSVMGAWRRPNGMRIERVRVPLGVVGVIYESRPNVTADAGALCLKAGNAVLLRGGSDSFRSSQAIHTALVAGLREANLPAAAIALVPTREREAVGMMLAGLDGAIDVLVPRGGKSLVGRVQSEARIPVFAHLEASVTSTSTPRPSSPWPKRSCATPRCGAPACAAPPRRC